MKKRLLLVGGGGHCHSVLGSIYSCDEYDMIGIVAKDEDNIKEIKKSDIVADLVVGTDKELPTLLADGWEEAFVTLGSIGNPAGRIGIYSQLKSMGFIVPPIIDESSVISNNTHIGDGAYIGKNTVVNVGSEIGKCAIINTGAIVEHDCRIGEFAHISPGTVLCGQVTIGDNTHVGAGTIVIQGITVGKNSLIGAGSVVVSDIPDGVRAYGNPCRVVE